MYKNLGPCFYFFFSSFLLDDCFELALGLELYPLKLYPSQILIDSIKKNSFVVHNFILLQWLNYFPDQYSVRIDKKNSIKNKKILCLTYHNKVYPNSFRLGNIEEVCSPRSLFHKMQSEIYFCMQHNTIFLVKVLPKCNVIAKIVYITLNHSLVESLRKIMYMK